MRLELAWGFWPRREVDLSSIYAVCCVLGYPWNPGSSRSQPHLEANSNKFASDDEMGG
jgi:hypothetical protein